MQKISTIFFLFLALMFVRQSSAQYAIHSPYLNQPEKAIGYVDSCAQFWVNSWDDNLGGFFSNLDKYGNVIYNNQKNTLTQSRNAYGLVRAYMLTGDTTYLNMAGGALDFMYQHGWDYTYGGFFQELDVNGNALYPYSDKTAFYQHYALLGIAAYYEATADTTAWNWLMQGYNHLESNFWDSRTNYLGYYDITSYSGANARDKSFNATVDAVTTHLLYLWLMTEDPVYKSRLLEMAQEMKSRLLASMPAQAIGFVESYDSDWNWDNSNTMTIMGHVLKTAWCLARIYQIEADPSYLPSADSLFRNVWDNGYDHQLGGPYKDFDRTTGQMLMWGLPDTAKAWWQMEQGVTAGLMLFHATGNSVYLQMADESLDFFMKYFVDHQYGEVYADRTRYGGLAWNENKASDGKAGYHSIELGYYVYLYGKFFVQKQPAMLHYRFTPSPVSRQIKLSPLAIADSSLRIESVLHEGQAYANFDPASRTLNLPAGLCGEFEVTFTPVGSTIISRDENSGTIQTFSLYQNYPNPFNPATTIEFSLPHSGLVTLQIYNTLGQEVTTLVSKVLGAGNHKYEWDAGRLASGFYFCKMEANGHTQIRKMLLVR